LPVVKVHDFSVYMKKIITISCFCLPFIALALFVGTQTACQKEATNCTAVITVKDSNANPVSSVNVKLYAPHGQVEQTGTTNAAGDVTFTFTLPAIFNVAAAKGLSLNDTLKGSGIIQLEVGQTESTTVIVK
jgi:uncharacterized protein YfaS (alpha-2-macroglobulin family)